MKINKLILLLTVSLLFFGCSRNDEQVHEDINTNFTLGATSSYTFSCIDPESTDCIPGMSQNIIDNLTLPVNTAGFDAVIMTFPNAQNQEEMDCIRNQYFYCYPELRFSSLQSTIFNKRQVWLFRNNIIGTGDTISTDIDHDDRVCKGPNCD